MSAFLDKSNAIKERLESIPALSSIDVLVDHQKDIKSEFAKAVAKIKGGVVVIFFDSYTTDEEEVAESRVVSDFILLVWTKPIIRGGETPADDIVSEIHKSLHGWKHDPESCRNKVIISRGRVVPNPKFLVHEIRIKIKHYL
jgi:hypothetical protein